MTLPPAKTILEACEAAGLPRTIHTVWSWTSGRVCAPVWVPVVIAEYTGLDAGDLATDLTARWRVKRKPTPSPR